MRVKLDENVPASVLDPLSEAGADVDTVADEGLVGAADPAVLAAASDVGRLVVTMDRGFGDVRAYPPGSHGGIVVLRMDQQTPGGLPRPSDSLSRPRSSQPWQAV